MVIQAVSPFVSQVLFVFVCASVRRHPHNPRWLGTAAVTNDHRSLTVWNIAKARARKLVGHEPPAALYEVPNVARLTATNLRWLCEAPPHGGDRQQAAYARAASV